jgi:hypothetical protein
MIKSLIYHVCPLRNNDIWRRNLQQLLWRIELFDGKRVIAVAHDGGERLHDPDEVAAMFSGVRATLLRRRNDRHLREVASFRDLLEEVKDLGPDNAVFYAHTKGNSTTESVEGATYWRNMMYHELLDEHERCMRLLEAYDAVGTTKIVWPRGFRSPYPSRLEHGSWMFAGTFFWFHAHTVFSRPNAMYVPQDRYGAEAWLSGILDASEAKSVFQPWLEDQFPNPYDPRWYIRSGNVIPDGAFDYPRDWCI